jgi:hypothetical protein
MMSASNDNNAKHLRKIELEAYRHVINAFRAQGDITWPKLSLLGHLQSVLRITTERHNAELLRAESDQTIQAIAKWKSEVDTSVVAAVDDAIIDLEHNSNTISDTESENEPEEKVTTSKRGRGRGGATRKASTRGKTASGRGRKRSITTTADETPEPKKRRTSKKREIAVQESEESPPHKITTRPGNKNKGIAHLLMEDSDTELDNEPPAVEAITVDNIVADQDTVPQQQQPEAEAEAEIQVNTSDFDNISTTDELEIIAEKEAHIVKDIQNRIELTADDNQKKDLKLELSQKMKRLEIMIDKIQSLYEE